MKKIATDFSVIKHSAVKYLEQNFLEELTLRGIVQKLTTPKKA